MMHRFRLRSRFVSRTHAARRAFAGTAASLAVSLVLTACARGLMPPKADLQALSPGAAGNTARSVGVLVEGWHTGLVIPANALGPGLISVRERYRQARYFAFGWGNRAYYTTPHPGSGSALRALLPSPSVLYVRALPAAPSKALPVGSTVHWVCVSAVGTHKLDAFLAHSVRRQRGGQPMRLERGPWPHSEFLASTARYDALHTCNTWTAAALSFANLPVHSAGVLFARQVMAQIRGLHGC